MIFANSCDTELANAYIKTRVADGEKPFQVAWIKSDTFYSIQYLKTGDADIAITYNPSAEQIAIKQGTAKEPSYYAFRDHFLLVGPKSNPANISKQDDILTTFANLHEAAEGPATEPPVRFLSRYDKSATNIKETLLWAGIGQVGDPEYPSCILSNPRVLKAPWATAYSTWYHQYIAFPIQALTAAILLQEYTITDRGTILSLDSELRNQTVIYKAGSDKADDPLLNPAHALIGEKAPNGKEAAEFIKWLVSDEGQDVIAGFKKDGQVLYSKAPSQ
jgi:ABC-type tungstate transport system permease subunit